MAKRARGTRPGQRRRLIRQPARHAPPSTSSRASAAPAGLTAAEEAQAEVFEAKFVAQEKAAEEARGRAARRAAEGDPGFRSRGRESGMLAVRTADELVVVRRDLRRILIIDGGLVAVLVGLWILASVTGILRI
jgi:hypothetical protein